MHECFILRIVPKPFFEYVHRKQRRLSSFTHGLFILYSSRKKETEKRKNDDDVCVCVCVVWRVGSDMCACACRFTPVVGDDVVVSIQSRRQPSQSEGGQEVNTTGGKHVGSLHCTKSSGSEHAVNRQSTGSEQAINRQSTGTNRRR
jgi:hypothetical protein